MAILPAGTFKVGPKRRAIPASVKLAVLARKFYEMIGCTETMPLLKWTGEIEAAAQNGKLRFDHRPPLLDRDYDTEAEDFIPAQNDPLHIDLLLDIEHDVRTFGAYGEPQRGDLTNRARIKEISNKHEDFKERQAAKAGQKHERRVLPTRKKSPPKRKIANRGFQKGGPKRKLQSRGFR